MNRSLVTLSLLALLTAGAHTAFANPTISTTDRRFTTTAGAAQSAAPSVAYNKDRDLYLVVFEGPAAGDVSMQIRDHLFAEVGTAHTIAIGGFTGPVAAYNPVSKEFVVAMVKDDVYAVHALPLRGDGAFNGPSVQVSTNLANQFDLYPRISVDNETGNVLFIWQADNPSSHQDVRGRLFDKALSPIGLQTTYADATTLNLVFPDVAYNSAANEFLISYADTDPTLRKILARRVTAATGASAGTEITVASRNGLTRTYVTYHAGSDKYLVVYDGYRATTEIETFGRFLSSAGVPAGAGDFRITNAGADGVVAFSAQPDSVNPSPIDGGFLVTWFGDSTADAAAQDDIEVFGTQLDANGTKVGTDFRISFQGTSGDLATPALRSATTYDSDRDRFLVVWEGDTSSASVDTDIFAKEFTTGTVFVCGNGTKSGTEACDDAGTSPGDGCSPVCNIEPGWDCTGPSCVCVSNCITSCAPGSSATAGPVSAFSSSAPLQSDNLFATKHTVTTAFTLQQMGIRSNLAQSSARLAVYTDVGDAPSSLLAQTPPFDLIGADQHIDVTSAVQLPAGNYWFALVVKNVGLLSDATLKADTPTTTPHRSQALAFTAAMPSTFAPTASFNTKLMNVYALGCDCPAAGGGIPGPGCATPPACGDGTKDTGEACDDDNTNAGDGCAADCLTIESGFVCPTPGVLCGCAPGRFGAACAECPGTAATPCNNHGTCGQGLAGNGACSCNIGFAAPACGTCSVGFIGYPTCIAEIVEVQLLTLSSTSAVPGGTKTFTVEVKNNGNSPRSPVVRVTLPSATTIVPSSGSGWVCALGSGEWTCDRTYSAVAAGATVSSTFTGAVDTATTAASLAVTGAITAIPGDTTPANDTKSHSALIDQTVDLATVLDCPASANPGDTVTCTATVTNSGSGNAQATTVAMVVLAGTTFDVANSPGFSCAPNANAGSTCTRSTGTILHGANAASTLKFSVLSPAGLDLESLALTATPGTTNTETPTGNNLGTDTVTVTAAPILTIATVPADTSVDPGQTFNTTFTVTNSGNQDAKAAVFSATVPNVLTAVSGSGWTCTPGATTTTCTRAAVTIPVATPLVVTLSLTVVDPVAEGIATAAIASSVTHARVGAEGGADTDSVNVTIDAVPVVVVDTLTPTSATVVPGATQAYVVTVKNTGHQAAKGVQIEVPLPLYGAYQASGSTAGWTCDATKCLFNVSGPLAGNNASASATIVVKFDGFLPANVTSTTVTAKVIDDGTNGPASNSTKSVTTNFNAAPDLVVNVTSSGAAVPGTPYEVTITVSNAGNQEATNVLVEASFPDTSGAATSDIEWACAPQGGNVTKCTRSIAILDLAPKASKVRPVPLSPFTAGKQAFTGSAAVSDDTLQGTDPNTANNTKSLSVDITAKPTLALTKTDDGNATSPGTRLVYTLGYAVTGTQHAQALVLSETVPVGAVFVASASTSGWTCANQSPAGTPCTLAVGNVNVGASGSALFAVNVTTTAAAGPLSNAASLADNGQNGAKAVQTATASNTRTVRRCDLDYSFETGNGPFIPESLFQRIPNGGDFAFKTNGTSNIGSGRQTGRLQADIAVPSVAAGGPNPMLEVSYRLEGDPNPQFDVFAICLNDSDCDGQTLGTLEQTGVNTAGPGFEDARVSLRAFAGQTVHVTILFDTISSQGTGVPGLTVRNVRIVSDVDKDGLPDGTFPECELCWDEDEDNYVHVASPGGGACPNNATRDCDDLKAGTHPGADELCGVVGDEDCNGLADGLDTDGCGFEDCANGLDDNGDGKKDCLDPVCAGKVECATCFVGFALDAGLGGFTLADNDPDGVPATQVFGPSTAGADKGYRTAPNGTLADVNASNGPVRATMTRVIEVPAGTPDPALFVRYSLNGDSSTGTDVFGVCFNTSPALCHAGTAAAAAPFKTEVETAIRTQRVPLPVTAGPVTVTLFYDTVNNQNNANTGVFIDSVIVGSDQDADQLFEFDAPECDHCVDGDGDGFGSKVVDDEYVVACPNTARDCDDSTSTTKPGGAENCALPGDNNCNGKGDSDEVLCSSCGDDAVTAGELCDDGNSNGGDGCSASCALEAGAIVITEIHAPFGAGPQWVEVRNATLAPLNVLHIGLLLQRQTGAQLDTKTCAVLPGKDTDIPAGARYVIAIVPSGNSLQGLAADLSCPAAGFQLATNGDSVRVKAASLELDLVDYNTFACELLHIGTTTGRSLELVGATTAAGNDTAAVWCLAGPGPGAAGPTQLGSPGTVGTCAERACDAADDDCDGTTDEGLLDADNDGVCEPIDCDGSAPTCSTDCVTDSDGDQIVDCKDGCIDNDGDGYGAAGGLAVSTCTGGNASPVDCNDALSFVHPNGTESGNDACTNGEDDDCDSIPDCAEAGCAALSVCAGESCTASATTLTCGQTLTVEPATNELPCGSGDDAVLRFVASRTESVTISLANLGQRQFRLLALPGPCSNGSCNSPIAETTVGCASPAEITVPVTSGQTYAIVADSVGPCPGTGAGSARVQLRCQEVCTGTSDADADGFPGCLDSDCVPTPGCATADFDGDGASNGVEATCLTDALSSASTPTADDISNSDADPQINCEDTDDDGDGAADAVEKASCPLNGTAKNDKRIQPGAELECELAGIDADCNQKYDSTEIGCGAVESQCGDGFDNDGDQTTDCADSNCVTSPLCGSDDFDGDGIDNGIELLCNTDAGSGTSVPAGTGAVDHDNDSSPSCADTDDDGDGADDVTEALCGSGVLDANDKPGDSDVDGKCDAVDPDDDNDGFSDAIEATCGTNADSGTSTPEDATNDIDQDKKCNALDVDIDGDNWTNGVEVACGTNPADKADTPGASNDGDDDGKCDALDDDDDNDDWTDAQEQLCGTSTTDPLDTPVDTDGDKYCDALDTDSDADGWPDLLETQCGTKLDDKTSNPEAAGQDVDDDGLCDSVDEDDDGDSWVDEVEAACGTGPLVNSEIPKDTDGDKACDALDDDDDDDGWKDQSELVCGTDPVVDASKPVDADGDGLCDAVDPEADPDGDGWTSFEETSCGTDATSAGSKPVDTDGDHDCDKSDPDDDNDGWSDALEGPCGTNATDITAIPLDSDSDGACDPVDTDDDGDGAPDADEALCGQTGLDAKKFPTESDLTDTDKDTKANCIDDDDDGDLVSDGTETTGGTNPLVADTDGDGLGDGVEDVNADGVVDAGETKPTVKDSDKDGLSDGLEAGACYQTAPCAGSKGTVPDTDGDGLSDGKEDADGDGAVGVGETNPLVADSDGDTFKDGTELGCQTDPLDGASQPEDADANGVCDRAETDSDGDGIPDGLETLCKTDPGNAADAPGLKDLKDSDDDKAIDCADDDDDDDGVADAAEIQCGSGPLDAKTPSPEDILDTDGDGLLDCAASDQDDDNDGLSDLAEAAVCVTEDEACDAGTPSAGAAGTCSDPFDKDTDDDGIPDGKEVVILGTHPAMADTDCDGIQDGTELGLTKKPCTRDAGGCPPTTDTDADVFVADADPSTATDPKLADTDHDGVSDGEEDKNHDGAVAEGEGNPLSAVDGLNDTDGDGLPDRVEVELGTDILDPDTDDDGLDDKTEVSVTNTDPKVADTDSGGVPDGIEVEQKTDPNVKEDDYSKSVASGDNVFGCGSGAPATGAAWLLLLGVAACLALGRRRSGGTRHG